MFSRVCECEVGACESESMHVFSRCRKSAKGVAGRSSCLTSVVHDLPVLFLLAETITIDIFIQPLRKSAHFYVVAIDRALSKTHQSLRCHLPGYARPARLPGSPFKQRQPPERHSAQTLPKPRSLRTKLTITENIPEPQTSPSIDKAHHDSDKASTHGKTQDHHPHYASLLDQASPLGD